ncbi:uncharacterized protein LOC112588425 [Harpegnathos saltator]|uniref:uncharacterized protein LOC112588424 n=1 Tax=Harpegnathos saltator TaxID=610380 RepID=UPI000DBEDDEC|nr:uncharacterized protein LOC112588424 [Harpegnathos saltator]XP_025154124.1 uncharacterized protein LOC112588425 [Harpegnathos saltator]
MSESATSMLDSANSSSATNDDFLNSLLVQSQFRRILTDASLPTVVSIPASLAATPTPPDATIGSITEPAKLVNRGGGGSGGGGGGGGKKLNLPGSSAKKRPRQRSAAPSSSSSQTTKKIRFASMEAKVVDDATRTAMSARTRVSFVSERMLTRLIEVQHEWDEARGDKRLSRRLRLVRLIVPIDNEGQRARNEIGSSVSASAVDNVTFTRLSHLHSRINKQLENHLVSLKDTRTIIEKMRDVVESRERTRTNGEPSAARTLPRRPFRVSKQPARLQDFVLPK